MLSEIGMLRVAFCLINLFWIASPKSSSLSALSALNRRRQKAHKNRAFCFCIWIIYLQRAAPNYRRHVLSRSLPAGSMEEIRLEESRRDYSKLKEKQRPNSGGLWRGRSPAPGVGVGWDLMLVMCHVGIRHPTRLCVNGGSTSEFTGTAYVQRRRGLRIRRPADLVRSQWS